MKFFLLTIPLLILTSCFTKDKNIETKKPQAIINKGFIIDVREEHEVLEGMIQGSHWFSLLSMNKDTKSQVAQIKKLANNKPIYVYCRSGKRAQKFVDILKQSGIQAKNIGGYKGLLKKGFKNSKVEQKNLVPGYKAM